MTTPIDQVPEWKPAGRASAGGFNAVLKAVRNLHHVPPVPGIVDSSGSHPRRPIDQITIDQFQLLTEFPDYLLCKLFDGVTARHEVTIAKPPQLRGHVAVRTVNNEEQSIQPPYVAGDLIYAVRPRSGTCVVDTSNHRVDWLDISARRWAAGCDAGSSS